MKITSTMLVNLINIFHKKKKFKPKTVDTWYLYKILLFQYIIDYNTNLPTHCFMC